MKRTHKAVVVAVVIGVIITVLVGCGPQDQGSAPQAAEQEATDTSQQAQDSEQEPAELQVVDGAVVIEMQASRGRNYNTPIGLHVEPGTTIRFMNMSGMHSTTAYHPDNGRELRIPEGAEAWDSGMMTGRGQSFEVTLTVEGVYDYYCIPHEAMGHVGRIIVGDPDAAPVGPADNLPAAARNALPAVDQIMAEHVVLP